MEEYRSPFIIKTHIKALVEGNKVYFNVEIPRNEEVVYSESVRSRNYIRCAEELAKRVTELLNGQSTNLDSEKCPIYYAKGGALQIDGSGNAILIKENDKLTFPNSKILKAEDMLNPAKIMSRPALEDIILLDNGNVLVPKVKDEIYNDFIESTVLNAVKMFASGGIMNPYGIEYANALVLSDDRNIVSVAIRYTDGEIKLGSTPAIVNINSDKFLMEMYSILKYKDVNFNSIVPQRVFWEKHNPEKDQVYIVNLEELYNASIGDKIKLVESYGSYKRDLIELYNPSAELRIVLDFLKYY
ncbi:MAG: hypothetical protein QW471_00975 [Candidatus Woesearchaeota archaeon]